MKFTENGVVRIKINLLEKRGKFNRLKVEVLDSGIGITRENLAILFNAFQQVDNSTTKTFGGTGLGLAISKELCRLMKGEIGVESELGEGSNFWFTVELKQTDISPSMMIRNNDEFHIVDHFKNYQPHLLLVDDNATNRKVASQILIKAGCKVITADSGMKAIELVKSSVNERFDLILMDIQMPEMDGIETTKRLREMEGAGLPPVVAMTAYAMKEDRDRFLSNGMNDYISKPIRAENLVRKVKEWVDKKLSVKTVTSVSDQEKPKSEENLVAEAGSPELFEEILKKLPVLDNEILKQLADSVGGEMDFVVSILEGFEEEALEQIRNAKTGFLENDCRAVQSELHTLKGNSGTLGVMRLHEITRHIEVKAKVCDFRDFEEEIRILESEFEAFQEVYRELAQKVSEK
ncbi:response regulator [Pseudarcicella hirudinis]|uniref:response regulator n=1 Tax=Pseudarcicella hirudinis TaxID=1079859 RepID=UPI0035EDD6E2